MIRVSIYIYNCYAIKQNKVELIDTQGKINQ